MPPDFKIEQDVIDELDYEPGVDSAGVMVAVENGMVTLTGHVPAYFQKLMTEKAVWRIAWVRGIVQDVEVLPSERDRTSDEDLACRAMELLHCNVQFSYSAIQLDVQNGWLELRGEVQWQCQRDAAEKALSGMAGLLGLLNRIVIVPTEIQPNIRECIESALRRRAGIEAPRVMVTVQGGKVTLEGQVQNALKRKAIRQSAWSVAGVIEVLDKMTLG